MVTRHRGLGPNADPFETREDHILAFQLYRMWRSGSENDPTWLMSQAVQLNNSTVFHNDELLMRVPAKLFLFLIDAAQKKNVSIPAHVLELVSGAKTIVMCAGEKTPILISLKDTVNLLVQFLPNNNLQTVDFFEQWRGV